MLLNSAPRASTLNGSIREKSTGPACLHTDSHGPRASPAHAHTQANDSHKHRDSASRSGLDDPLPSGSGFPGTSPKARWARHSLQTQPSGGGSVCMAGRPRPEDPGWCEGLLPALGLSSQENLLRTRRNLLPLIRRRPGLLHPRQGCHTPRLPASLPMGPSLPANSNPFTLRTADR